MVYGYALPGDVNVFVHKPVIVGVYSRHVDFFNWTTWMSTYGVAKQWIWESPDQISVAYESLFPITLHVKFILGFGFQLWSK